MANSKSERFPYKNLGLLLRSLREKEKESVPDVSGAVEIESELLLDIEEGLKPPSEDILLLLISHFGLKNDEAMKLWRMAGYDNITETTKSNNFDNLNHQPAVFLLPIDSRIVYTDLIQVTVNNFGIVINFQQYNPQQNNQPLTVARVGMSREHAETVVSILNQVLNSKSKKPQKLIKRSNSKSKNQKNKNIYPGAKEQS
jgi:hypothetical protein